MKKPYVNNCIWRHTVAVRYLPASPKQIGWNPIRRRPRFCYISSIVAPGAQSRLQGFAELLESQVLVKRPGIEAMISYRSKPLWGKKVTHPRASLRETFPFTGSSQLVVRSNELKRQRDGTSKEIPFTKLWLSKVAIDYKSSLDWRQVRWK